MVFPVASLGRVARVIVIAATATLAAGCAQINIYSDKAPPRSEWKFGVLAIDLAGSNKNTIVHSSGVGLISTPSGSTLGYANAKIVRIGDQCRVVIATKDLDATSKDRELLRLLRATHKACAA
jgi:hypothetical protein